MADTRQFDGEEAIPSQSNIRALSSLDAWALTDRFLLEVKRILELKISALALCTVERALQHLQNYQKVSNGDVSGGQTAHANHGILVLLNLSAAGKRMKFWYRQSYHEASERFRIQYEL